MLAFTVCCLGEAQQPLLLDTQMDNAYEHCSPQGKEGACKHERAFAMESEQMLAASMQSLTFALIMKAQHLFRPIDFGLHDLLVTLFA